MSRSAWRGRPGRHRCGSSSRATPALTCSEAVRAEPSAFRPLVQARSGATLRPPGGREAVSYRPAAGTARGLHAAGTARCRAADPCAIWLRGADTGTGVSAGHRVLRRRHRAGRGRDRRSGHRRRATWGIRRRQAGTPVAIAIQASCCPQAQPPAVRPPAALRRRRAYRSKSQPQVLSHPQVHAIFACLILPLQPRSGGAGHRRAGADARPP